MLKRLFSIILLLLITAACSTGSVSEETNNAVLSNESALEDANMEPGTITGTPIRVPNLMKFQLIESPEENLVPEELQGSEPYCEKIHRNINTTNETVKNSTFARIQKCSLESDKLSFGIKAVAALEFKDDSGNLTTANAETATLSNQKLLYLAETDTSASIEITKDEITFPEKLNSVKANAGGIQFYYSFIEVYLSDENVSEEFRNKFALVCMTPDTESNAIKQKNCGRSDALKGDVLFRSKDESDYYYMSFEDKIVSFVENRPIVNYNINKALDRFMKRSGNRKKTADDQEKSLAGYFAPFVSLSSVQSFEKAKLIQVGFDSSRTTFFFDGYMPKQERNTATNVEDCENKVQLKENGQTVCLSAPDHINTLGKYDPTTDVLTIEIQNPEIIVTDVK